MSWSKACLTGWLWLCRGVAVSPPHCGTTAGSMGKCQFRTPWNYLHSAPSSGLLVNTAFLPTVMKSGVFQNKYCFLVTNINKCIAHYIFGEECARPTFLKSNGEVLPLFPSSLHTGKLPLESLGICMTKNYRGTQKYFFFFFSENNYEIWIKILFEKVEQLWYFFLSNVIFWNSCKFCIL